MVLIDLTLYKTSSIIKIKLLMSTTGGLRTFCHPPRFPAASFSATRGQKTKVSTRTDLFRFPLATRGACGSITEPSCQRRKAVRSVGFTALPPIGWLREHLRRSHPTAILCVCLIGARVVFSCQLDYYWPLGIFPRILVHTRIIVRLFYFPGARPVYETLTSVSNTVNLLLRSVKP